MLFRKLSLGRSSTSEKRLPAGVDKPAGEGFKNIKMLNAMPAGRLLGVMELGYAKSLGVDCTLCHIAAQWEKEDSSTKQIARDMAALVATINKEQWQKIKNLKSAESVRMHDVTSRPNNPVP